MRRFFLLLGFLLTATAIPAADLRPAIKRDAAKCAAAWQRNDYAGVLAFLPPRVIQQSGGRAAALKKIKNQFSLARDYGVERMDFNPGQPAIPRTVGKWLTSLVPLSVVLHRPPVDITQETHLLALSNDQGKNWLFVPLYRTSQAKLNAYFPEFAGKIVVPIDPDPELGVAF